MDAGKGQRYAETPQAFKALLTSWEKFDTVFRRVLSPLSRAVLSPSEIEVKISEIQFDYTRGIAISPITMCQAP